MASKNTLHTLMTVVKSLLVLFTLIVAYHANPLFAIVYLVMSIVTFGVYWFDKRAAIRSQRRVPENSLHLLELICGWPGALLAQAQLRHKSQKQPFKAILWAMIVINIGVLYWFYPLSL